MEYKKDRVPEKYQRACLTITEFDTEDVITTSGPTRDIHEHIILAEDW